MSTNKRIVSTVDDDIYIAQLFHEALSENIAGISVFSFNDPVMAFEHFTENEWKGFIVVNTTLNKIYDDPNLIMYVESFLFQSKSCLDIHI